MKERLKAWSGNLGSFLLAVILAIAVWVSAVTANNPDLVQKINQTVLVQVEGLGEGLVAVGYHDVTPNVSIRAPRSVWQNLRADNVSLFLDASGLVEGTYSLPVRARVGLSPARVESIDPAVIEISIEPLVVRMFPVRAEFSGSLAPGFSAGLASVFPSQVEISGPASLVDRVADVVVPMALEGLRSDLELKTDVIALDAAGFEVDGLEIRPYSVSVTVPVQQQGGYRDVVVKAVIVGSVQNGYRLTGLSVTPSVVTLYSDDPQLVLSMPGFVETEPLDITNATDDISRSLTLDLPKGVRVVGDSTVRVDVNISAIEDSLSLSRPIEFRNLGPGLSVELSPTVADVILSGPLSVLRDLLPADIEVYVDLQDLVPGTYTLTPVVQVSLGNVRLVTLSPEQIQVVITRSASSS